MQTEGEEKELKLSMLSSGEKQIVSLFSHIYLSGIQEFFVVIDEPELSLSVPWQKRFLMDIVSSGRCSGLIAVTHSPFIYDNELDGYAHSIEEFVEVV
jgi:predicted ATPase